MVKGNELGANKPDSMAWWWSRGKSDRVARVGRLAAFWPGTVCQSVTLKHKGSCEQVYAGRLSLIPVKTKTYLAIANYLPRPTASFPRRRESRSIHSVQRV